MTCEQKLSVLMQLGQGIAQERDLGAFLETLGASARALVGADRCSIFVYDTATHTFWSQVAQGLEERLHIPFERGVIGACATSKETVIVNDAYGDHRFFDEIDRFTGYKTHSILAVPLLGQERQVIGILQALNKREGLFGDDEAKMLQLLGSYAGAMLENALLHDELQHRFRQKSEQLQARNLELETANRQIEQLLNEQDRLIKTAIHEINTPVSVINTHLEVIADQIKEPKYLRRLFSATKVLSSIYDDFRYLSSKTKAPYPKERLDLSGFAQARVTYFDDIAAARGQRLTARIESGLYGRYSAVELQRVIDNTLSNAVKYSPEESDIVLEMKRQGSHGVLCVRDEGPGIKNPERIFERYYREQERIGGFGMGLAIVKAICDENHIEVAIEPNRPAGTVFTYRLPLTVEAIG